MAVSVLHYSMKMNVTLKANDKSSRRTINRIREHGPNFRAVKSGSPDALGGHPCWLFRAEDGWFGWLHRAEFDWAHVEDPLHSDWKNVFPWVAWWVTQDDSDFRDMMPTSEEFYLDYAGMAWKD